VEPSCSAERPAEVVRQAHGTRASRRADHRRTAEQCDRPARRHRAVYADPLAPQGGGIHHYLGGSGDPSRGVTPRPPALTGTTGSSARPRTGPPRPHPRPRESSPRYSCYACLPSAIPAPGLRGGQTHCPPSYNVGSVPEEWAGDRGCVGPCPDGWERPQCGVKGQSALGCVRPSGPRPADKRGLP